jgi:hypothetical protein
MAKKNRLLDPVSPPVTAPVTPPKKTTFKIKRIGVPLSVKKESKANVPWEERAKESKTTECKHCGAPRPASGCVNQLCPKNPNYNVQDFYDHFALKMGRPFAPVTPSAPKGIKIIKRLVPSADVAK